MASFLFDEAAKLAKLVLELGKIFEFFEGRFGGPFRGFFVEDRGEILVWWIHPLFSWLILIYFCNKSKKLRFSSLSERQSKSWNGSGRLSIHRIYCENQALGYNIFTIR